MQTSKKAPPTPQAVQFGENRRKEAMREKGKKEKGKRKKEKELDASVNGLSVDYSSINFRSKDFLNWDAHDIPGKNSEVRAFADFERTKIAFSK
jgi:hypothetical protein